MGNHENILEAKDVTKRFGDVVANDQVNLSVRRGEIHGILGENGAGKSTLMNILYGLYTPTDGTVVFEGEARQFASPKDAVDAGIGMVHQHFMLVPSMSVLENIVLGERELPPGYEPTGIGVLDRLVGMLTRHRSAPRERVVELTDEYGLDIDPDRKVWELDIGEQQRVEILKALYRDVDLLILDEPTAVLTPNEAEQMFETIQSLVEEGLTVIFITHKLWEVEELADRVTVLRDGASVETVATDGVTQSELAELMVGKEVLLDLEKAPVDVGDPVLQAETLRVEDDRGIEALSGVDLTVNRGEIVGVAGVSGNGQRELSQSLFGFRPLLDGRIRIDGEDLTGEPPSGFMDAGVSYIPQDRHEYGAAPGLSVMDNACAKEFESDRFRRYGFLLDYPNMAEYTRDVVDRFDIRGVGDVEETPAGDLSGGNLQKLILGRELDRQPDLLVANQPTRGVDVGAIESIRNLVLERRASGTGVVLVSEDLDELFDLSDRIRVIYEGEFVFETTPAATTKTEVGMAMTTGAPGEQSQATAGAGVRAEDR
ncbi:ABC transporter ATP-binding protein [Halorientalis pallida]|uniref:ABC transporter ATP-binding protein n=1 Tax=Halorientalis pallida TaxID=2479928 RepID=A0A498KZJ1_9EURY|nr:ABC transporter ATP-binding protein [Halorientalis pallida]RXK47970.1 ABC transporter ATP-binding protein [Halorientalis pallida]